MKLHLSAVALSMLILSDCKTNHSTQSGIKQEDLISADQIIDHELTTAADFYAIAGEQNNYVGYVHDYLNKFQGQRAGESYFFNKRNIFHADVAWRGITGRTTRPAISESMTAMKLFTSGEVGGGSIFYYSDFTPANTGNKTGETSTARMPGTVFIESYYMPTLSRIQDPSQAPKTEDDLHKKIASIIEASYLKAKAMLPFVDNMFFIYSMGYVPDAYKHHYAAILSYIGSPGMLEQAVGKNSRVKVHHATTSFGYLRPLSVVELKNSDYNAKEIVVLNDVPLDIGPTAGIISLKKQVPDSHVILRAKNMDVIDVSIPGEYGKIICPSWHLENNKATCDITDRDKMKSLKEYYGKPVEVTTLEVLHDAGEEATSDLLFMREVSAELVEQKLRERRPQLPDPISDLSVDDFYTMDMPEKDLKASVYGAKGRNFIALHRTLIANHFNREKFSGTFLIPFKEYQNHVAQPLTKKLCGEAVNECQKNYLKNQNLCQPYLPTGNKNDQFSLCLAEKISSAPDCAAFQNLCLSAAGQSINQFVLDFVASSHETLMSATSKRKQFFYFAQGLISQAPFSDTLEDKINAISTSTYGDHPPRIRYRSSTNAEDIAGLNGAGMYESAAGCLKEVAAKPGVTPFSQENCLTWRERNRAAALRTQIQRLGNYPELVYDITDDLQDKRSISKAIRKVYASLWSEKAFMYRDYFGIKHEKVFMGVLSHVSFIDESANGVVIARRRPDQKLDISITVQADDISITNPAIPNSYPDQITLVADHDGNFHEMNYVMHSNVSNQDILNFEELTSVVKQIVTLVGMWESEFHPEHLQLDFEIKRGPRDLPKGPEDQYPLVNQIDIKQMRPL